MGIVSYTTQENAQAIVLGSYHFKNFAYILYYNSEIQLGLMNVRKSKLRKVGFWTIKILLYLN